MHTIRAAVGAALIVGIVGAASPPAASHAAASPATDSVAADTTPPTVTPPRRGFQRSFIDVGGRILMYFPWTSTDAGSGVADHDVALQTDGGAWTSIDTTFPTATHLARFMEPLHTYRLKVRATDKAANTSAWVYTETFRVSRFNEHNAATTYHGTWTTFRNPGYWDGGMAYSSEAGATVSITFTGRAIAWVSQIGPSQGVAAVDVDGERLTTVDAYDPYRHPKAVVWSASWTTVATRTIKITVLGSQPSPWVYHDAFVTSG
jgi:hypothetical protein